MICGPPVLSIYKITYYSVNYMDIHIWNIDIPLITYISCLTTLSICLTLLSTYKVDTNISQLSVKAKQCWICLNKVP